MLLVFEEEHKEHLAFLTQVSVDVVQEFCRISLEFLKKGVNTKVYHSAAHKLGVEVTTVQHGVEGLMYLLSQASKLMMNDVDFHDSIMTLGFSEELRQHLLQVYHENQDQLRMILKDMTMDLPHYHNLEWRLDIQLATRSLRHQTTPLITMKLHTKDCSQSEATVLQTDPVNLLHLTNSLDEALQEIKTAHCRRILRNI